MGRWPGWSPSQSTQGNWPSWGFDLLLGGPGEGSMEANLTAKGGAKAGDSDLFVRLNLRVYAAGVVVQVEGAARVSLEKRVIPLWKGCSRCRWTSREPLICR